MFGNVTKQLNKFGLIRFIYKMLKLVQATCEHSVQTVPGGKTTNLSVEKFILIHEKLGFWS